MSLRKLVCLGDSLTNGARDEYYRTYPMELESLIHAAGKELTWCLNFGVNGETTGHILNRAYAVLAAHSDARFVLFLGGTNDTKVPIPPDLYRENVAAVIRLSTALGVEPALGLLPPLYGPGLPQYSQESGNRYVALYNDVLRQLADEHGIRLCDFSRYPRELYSDGVHLTHEGYRRMALDWFRTLEDDL